MIKHLKWLALGLTVLPQQALAQVFPQITPIAGAPNFGTVAGRVVSWIFDLAGILAVIYLIYGGIVYITAAGNEDKIKAGKSILINAIIGIVIIVLSYLIVRWITSILQLGTT